MVNFDKFEKRVKETYGKQEFPFDEQNWEKAAKMIDASRQGKNRGGIFLLSAVALLCTTGLVYYFGFSDSTDALKKNSLASNDLTANKELVVKPIKNSERPIENVVADHKKNQTVNSNSSAENVNAASKTKNSSSNLSGTSGNNSAITLSKSKDPNKSISESTTQNSTPETKTEEKANAKPVSNTSETKSNENKANNSSKKTPQPKLNSKNSIPEVLGSNNSNNNTSTAKTNPVTNGENGDKLGNPNSTNNNSPTRGANDNDTTNNIVALGGNPSESLVTDSFPFVKIKHADSLKFPAQIGGNGISYATNVKMEHDHKNFLFMEAGATYLLGWNGNGHTDAGGFNLVAGLNFQHYFTNNFSAQIGVQYSSIGNMTQTSHTISTVNYDLGIEKDITSIKYQKLHYVVAPIKVAYNVGKNNIIGVGCNVAYLLNSDSKKEKYTTYSDDPNAIKNNLTSSKESGYVQGFNPIDVQASVFYRRKIYKGLSANAEFIYGLTDVKNNAFFKSNTFERTTGFKLTLCYDLFKK
jgi:hypothetical protein